MDVCIDNNMMDVCIDNNRIWCMNYRQEEPKLVYTLFCCKPVAYDFSKKGFNFKFDYVKLNGKCASVQP